MILTGEYFEQRAWKGKDRKGVVLQEGKITWPSFTNPESLEKISPTSLSSVDPEAKDIGSNVLFDWVVQRKQWEKKCVKHQQVAEVERFKTAWEQTRYRQKHVETCISEKYIRYCPSGQALFKKLMPAGTCLKEAKPRTNSISRIWVILLSSALRTMWPPRITRSRTRKVSIVGSASARLPAETAG